MIEEEYKKLLEENADMRYMLDDIKAVLRGEIYKQEFECAWKIGFIQATVFSRRELAELEEIKRKKLETSNTSSSGFEDIDWSMPILKHDLNSKKI